MILVAAREATPRPRLAQPAVTVVLPIYNGERFLAEAIDSILNQTFQDFELLVLDDGSKDASLKIARQYERNPRVRLHANGVNRGITATLRAGCEMAAGELIAIANQDDICLPNRLAKQVAFMHANPDVAIVGAAAEIIDAAGRTVGTKSYPTQAALAAWRMHFSSTLLHPASMIRRRALEEIGGYPIGYGGGTEDYAMNVRLARVGRVANLPDVLLKYRLHDANVTRQRWEEQEAEATRIVAEQCTWITGARVPVERARQLRGLSTENYPRDPNDIEALARLIRGLHAGFISRAGLPRADAALVSRDAGMRLWLLAALAARRAPALSARLVYAAVKTSPASALTFGRKIGHRVFARLRGSHQ